MAILKRRTTMWLTLWVMLGAFLVGWALYAAGVNAHARGDARAATKRDAKIANFYRVIGGELPGDEPGPANKLARDLRRLNVDRLRTFSGDSNRYGGITHDLGFDPFNGTNCHECGPLDDEVIINVIEIRNGHLSDVLSHYSGAHTTKTVSSVSTFIWFLWIFSLPGGVATIYILKRRNEEDRYQGFVEERNLISELRRAKAELPAGGRDWQQLDALETRLEQQLEVRINYTHSKAQQMKLEHLVDEANDTLEAITAGNQTLE